MVFKRAGGFGGRERGRPGAEKSFGRPSFGSDRGDRGDRFEKKKFGGKPSFGGRGGGDMHPATCSSCGKSFELPFRPSGDRPVFCKDCFMSKGDKGSAPREHRDAAPRFERRDDRREERTQGGDPRIEKMAKEIENISRKLDGLVRMIADKAITEEKKIEKKQYVAEKVEKGEVVATVKPKAVAKKVAAVSKVVAKKKPAVKNKK